MATGKPNGWTSTAPMSTVELNTRRKPKPRWSLVTPDGIPPFEPTSSSGPPAPGNMVCVVPPLSCNEPSSNDWPIKLPVPE